MKATSLRIALGLLLLAPALWANPSVKEIIDYVDTNYQLKSDMTAQARITTRDPEQGNKVIESVYYRRDSDDAFLIVIADPESDRGNGYMRVGDNLWMYRRATRTFTHIGRDEKIGGSNASAGDLETRKFKDLYKPALDASGKEIIAEDTIGGKIPVYRVEVTAKVNDVKYPKLVMWVTQDKYLELKRECYSLSGTLMETDLYTNYKNVEGRFVPLRMRFTDEVEKGRTSLLEITGINFAKVDDYKFDKSYLESLSK
ncbi:MAG TPA: outer membrane lipoprotein-sorting protein [Spirochaetia bacterium]|nr:outer membrane lipoprotein-sorting protein [Spirochaetia bacterium]